MQGSVLCVSAPLIGVLEVVSLAVLFTPTSLITNPQNPLFFSCLRRGHQLVRTRGAAGVHRRQRAFGRHDGRGLGLRGQTGGHPAQPGVLRTPQRRAMRAAVGHHLQRPSLHQGEQRIPVLKLPRICWRATADGLYNCWHNKRPPLVVREHGTPRWSVYGKSESEKQWSVSAVRTPSVITLSS